MANRTKKRVPAALRVPYFLTNPSSKEYEHALTITSDDKAHMMRTRMNVKLELKDGEFYFNDVPESRIDWSEIMTDNQSNTDIMPLKVLYSTLDQMVESKLRTGENVDWDEVSDRGVEVYIPDLMQKMGLKTNVSSLQVGKLVEKIAGYENVIGVVPKYDEFTGELAGYIYARAMLWHQVDSTKNTIRFVSPYFVLLKRALYEASLQYDRFNQIELNANGRPKRIPTTSRLLPARNRYSYGYEIAAFVCILIERVGGKGDRVPKVTAARIVEECPDLKRVLENETPAHRNTILKRAFKEGLRILDKESRLREAYVGIEIPDTDKMTADDWKEYLPTYTKLNSVIWAFPHKGRSPDYVQDEVVF